MEKFLVDSSMVETTIKINALLALPDSLIKNKRWRDFRKKINLFSPSAHFGLILSISFNSWAISVPLFRSLSISVSVKVNCKELRCNSG
ncbi:hypothetical protein C2G38_2235090 [Gigaspora rosea]|uniref:Uncharacterized protein n=1 Tax=Gigaspora rosea TaxID=44941 RepID=A0A397TU69_9GLOM|nr:hypothetical protein C2G38_2235090 [Gigaspora rosea]